MMKKPLSELKPGMILSRDLKQKDSVLLKAGAELTEVTLEILKKRQVLFADVSDDEVHHAPGAEMLFSLENPEYANRRRDIEELFSTVPEDDDQMEILKYCLIQQLEEEYRE